MMMMSVTRWRHYTWRAPKDGARCGSTKQSSTADQIGRQGGRAPRWGPTDDLLEPQENTGCSGSCRGGTIEREREGGWRRVGTWSQTGGAATPGQQQPTVGHKSSGERPFRQGESRGPGGATNNRTTQARNTLGGVDGDKRRRGQQAKQGGSSCPRGRAPSGARAGRVPAQQPAWQLAETPKLPGPAGSPRGQQRRARRALPGGHPSPGTPVCVSGTHEAAEPFSKGSPASQP